MARMREASLLEHALGDRVGNKRGRQSMPHIGDGVLDRLDDTSRIGNRRPAGDRRLGEQHGTHRQPVREHRCGIVGRGNDLDLDRCLGTARQRDNGLRIPVEHERRHIAVGAHPPRLGGDLDADAGRITHGECQWEQIWGCGAGHPLTILDEGVLTQVFQMLLGQNLEFLLAAVATVVVVSLGCLCFCGLPTAYTP